MNGPAAQARPAPPRAAGRVRLGPAGALLRASPWMITATLAIVYLIAQPPSSDLAAASYRSDLFSRAGFTLWDNSWYGGHHLPAYSLLAPALGALIGPRLLAALSVTAVAALFAVLIEGHFPARATRIAAAWMALGAGVALLSSRVPFDLGLALGLGALVCAQRGRRVLALGAALLCSLASPVAGAFLALAFVAWALAGPARRWPAALTLAALAPIGLLALAFPEGGSQPFASSAFFPALLGVLVIGALIGPEQRVLRVGTLLYALALSGSYWISTPVGSNSDRLGALAGGPLAACVLACAPGRWRRRTLLVAAPVLLYWQVNSPVADFAAAAQDPAVHSSYYLPLLGELRVLGIGYAARPARIEVVPVIDHWEARWMAPHAMLARGWERQLDQYRNALFYSESASLTPARYRAWLAAQAVSYIALPDARLDYSAASEARLLRARPPYLREVWRSPHWRLFEVLHPTPLAQAPGALSALGNDSLKLLAPRAGSYTVRVHFSPYWALEGAPGGCVASAPGGWTALRVPRAGSYGLVIRFSLSRLFSRGPRCA